MLENIISTLVSPDTIIGNVCNLGASISDAVSASRKTARAVLLVQVISQVFYCAGAIALKGYSAAVQNVVSILRNLFAAGGKRNQYLEWTLIALAVGLGLYFNNRGLLGLLPVIANLQYSLVVFRFKNDEKKLKIAFLIAVFLFTIFNFSILNIVGGVSNLALSIMTLIFLIRSARKTA